MSQHFIIVFFGLISHFGLGSGDMAFERAVLTAYDHHTPVLFLPDGESRAPISPQPFPLKPIQPCPGPPISGVSCYDLTGVHLQITGLPSGQLGSVDPHLPRLTKITDGTQPDNAVKYADVTF